MFNISDYLKKFATLGQSALHERDAILSSLREVCGVEGAEFEVKKGVLYVKGSSMLKSAVYTKKDAVLASLRSKSPGSKVYDIR
ncbi:MAG: hypothetical protein HZA81_04255 [Candidatus Taylorbacteria bacterium]|nr:hypothetical protein [Candidatus Taylorbacteria bacterium]